MDSIGSYHNNYIIITNNFKIYCVVCLDGRVIFLDQRDV